MNIELLPGIVLILGQRDVRALLMMRACMDAMADALRSLARDQVILPLRPVMWLPGKVGALGMMPAHSAALDRFGVKVVSVFPGNHGTPYDAHQGTVMLFEAKHGRLLALMDATAITAADRTAAVSGVATETLANPEAGDLAILGSGARPTPICRRWLRRGRCAGCGYGEPRRRPTRAPSPRARPRLCRSRSRCATQPEPR